MNVFLVTIPLVEYFQLSTFECKGVFVLSTFSIFFLLFLVLYNNMSAVNRRNLISSFSNPDLREYLIEHYVCPEVLQNKIEKLIKNSVFNSVNREELTEQAKEKCFKTTNEYRAKNW